MIAKEVSHQTILYAYVIVLDYPISFVYCTNAIKLVKLLQLNCDFTKLTMYNVIRKKCSIPRSPIGFWSDSSGCKGKKCCTKNFDLVWVLKIPYVSKHACVINNIVGERRICSGVIKLLIKKFNIKVIFNLIELFFFMLIRN